ncbi:MAG TPA: hypothetical protein VFQ61_14215 [Polyangiaceae bacterium]|nr:hypothetical protein [Polyangiaceae bacterium]
MSRRFLAATCWLLACGPNAAPARDPASVGDSANQTGPAAPTQLSLSESAATPAQGGSANANVRPIDLAAMAIAGSGPSLPAVSLRTLGLHIGGGPNDTAGKAPFVTAIESRFEDFLSCYRWVDEPGKSGTFGVDLHIERRGGKPRVEEPRAGLSGDKFQACVVRAFENVQFPSPGKPTVISYSLRFSVDNKPGNP